MVCEEKESEELSRLRGSFWEGGGEISSEAESKGEEMEEEDWEREVVNSLESLSAVAVDDG